jgi:hypothetical protein
VAALEAVEDMERFFWDELCLAPLLLFLTCMLGVAGCLVVWSLSRRGTRIALLTPLLFVAVGWPCLCYSMEVQPAGWVLNPAAAMIVAGADAATGELPSRFDSVGLRVLAGVTLVLFSGLFYLWGRNRFDDLVGRGP